MQYIYFKKHILHNKVKVIVISIKQSEFFYLFKSEIKY